jgi:hypothetical protein
MLLPDRVAYPSGHIEVDNRLTHYLDLVEERFGDSAGYVFIDRDPDDTAMSYLERWNLSVSVVRSHASGTLMSPGAKSKLERFRIARDYVDLTNAKIATTLARREHVCTVRLDEVEDDFRLFWKYFEIEGNLDKAIDEFGNRHNQNTFSTPQRRAERALAKSRRVIDGLPSFLRDI